MNREGVAGRGAALLAVLLAGGIGASALGAVEVAPGLPKIPELPEGFPFDIPRGEEREERGAGPGGDTMFGKHTPEKGCDLLVTKSHGDGVAYAGGQATYSITIVNVGDSPCAGFFTITDILPDGITPAMVTYATYPFTSSPPNQIYWAGSIGVWQPGVSVTIEITIDLPDDYEGEGLNNCVEINLERPREGGHAGAGGEFTPDVNPNNDKACDCQTVADGPPCYDILNDPAVWDSLVGWWAADGDETDSGPIGNHGSGSGVTYLSTPSAGMYTADFFVFDPAGAFVEVADPSDDSLDFGSGQDFTIDAWVRPYDNNGQRPIVDKRWMEGLSKSSGSAFHGYYFFLQDAVLTLAIGDGNAYLEYASQGPLVPNLAWTFVAVTVDRSSGNSVTFYHDGQPFGATAQAGVAPGGSLENDSALRIGHAVDLNLAYRGEIDEVEIFNRVLTQSAIQQIMEPGKCRQPACEPSRTVLDAGNQDDFRDPPTEPMPVLSPAVATYMTAQFGTRISGFDDPNSNRGFWYTFAGDFACPANATLSATLTLRLRSLDGAPWTDWLHLDPSFTTATTIAPAWSSSTDNLGVTTTASTVVLDLGNLAPDANGTTNILANLQDGEFHVYIQDDTSVDWMRLEIVCTCGDEAVTTDGPIVIDIEEVFRGIFRPGR